MRFAVTRSGGVLQHSPWDALLVALSAVHGAALLAVPSVPVVAVGLWWNANTIAHNFIHRPFFRQPFPNRVFSLWLSVLLGFPQSAWRERHLAHHASRAGRLRMTRQVALETALVVSSWAATAALAPRTFTFVYLPGWCLGLVLCWIQGHYEHAHGTISHHGFLYNALFFNDGYHAEHHLRPGRHWSQLGDRAVEGRVSRWPPVLRWLDALTLEGLERVVLVSPLLQRFVTTAHERALRRLLPDVLSARSVLIVGGGLYPRTAIVLRRLLPEATLTILDARADHLAVARTFLDDGVILREGWFAGSAPPDVDLVVVPLAYVGDRGRIYARPPGRATLVHDWIWSRHGESAVVSPWLLKRVNLVVAVGCGERLTDVRMSA